MNSPLPIVEDSTAAAGSSVRAKNESARNIAICLAAVSAAILATWPLAEGGYADDFAYMHVALNLSRTGRFVYNGWEFAMLIAHAGWGALAIKCFGFSFQVLRFSTIPFALGSVVLCYLLVQRAAARLWLFFLCFEAWVVQHPVRWGWDLEVWQEGAMACWVVSGSVYLYSSLLA